MPDFIAQIANCPIDGCEITDLEEGGWARNRLELSHKRHRATLIQRPGCMWTKASARNGECVHTTDLIIEDVPRARTRWALGVAEDLSWLLAFTTMSRVNVFQWQHGDEREGWLPRGTLRMGRCVVEPWDGEAVRNLLKTCWKAYRKEKKRRRLPTVIDYCVQTETLGIVVEYQLLGAFVTLENLKATHAENVRGLPYKKGFRDPNGRTYSFEELVKYMLDEQDMNPNLGPIVELRNEIVHRGLSVNPIGKLLVQYAEVHDLVREYILRLLRYDGGYFRYSTRNASPCRLVNGR